MDKEQIVLALRTQGNRSAVFADLQLIAKEACRKCHSEEEQITRSGVLTIVLSAASVMGAMSVGSIMAPVTLLTVGVAAAWAIGEHVTKTMPIADRAAELDKLLSDATPDEWATLAELCGTPEDFIDCLRAGFVAGNMRSAVKGTQYHSALTHAHGLGKVLPEGFKEPEKTGFGAPKQPRSWRDAPIDEPESDPTNAEIALILKLCNERVGVRAVADRILSLRDTNRQAALNLAIVHSGISDRDYVKGGLPLNRLRKIKAWAADGDKVILVLPPATPVIPEVEPIEPEVVAVKPSFVHVKAAAIVSPIEEDDFEEEHEEDDIEEEESVAAPIVVSPSFQRIAKPSISIWDSTDLDTIEPADIGNFNQFPIVMVVAGQGNGKTVTLGYIMEQLSGNKALFTPKADDHRNPSVQSIYDLRFGYDPIARRAAWFGTPESFDNSPMMDLDWYLNSSSNKHGSALDFIHAANQTAVNRTAKGTKKGRPIWRVVYDEAAQTYRSGFSRVVVDGVSLGSKGRQECQEFIAANLIPAIFNWRGAGVQLFLGCQSETVESVGLKGCAEARDEAWHLYPGLKSIEIAKKHKQSKLVSFLQRALSDGYAIALLEKEGNQFKIIRMPKLAELARFDPIVEDEDTIAEAPIIPSTNTVQPIAPAIQSLEDPWAEDEIIEEAIVESIEIESMEQIAGRIMAMQYLPLATRLQMIEKEAANRA